MKIQPKSKNDQTIQAYEANVELYVSGTPHVASTDVSSWMSRALAHLTQDSKILELGSAFGRDAADAKAKGYIFQLTDAAQSFVTLLQQKGYNAHLLNAITDDLGGPWDMVFANCVFLHFTVEEFDLVLQKIARSLNNSGILAFAVKQGKGSEWSSEKINTPRFFQYWTQPELKEHLSKTGFGLMDMRDGITQGDANKIYVIARKKITA